MVRFIPLLELAIPDFLPLEAAAHGLCFSSRQKSRAGARKTELSRRARTACPYAPMSGSCRPLLSNSDPNAGRRYSAQSRPRERKLAGLCTSRSRYRKSVPSDPRRAIYSQPSRALLDALTLGGMKHRESRREPDAVRLRRIGLVMIAYFCPPDDVRASARHSA